MGSLSFVVFFCFMGIIKKNGKRGCFYFWGFQHFFLLVDRGVYRCWLHDEGGGSQSVNIMK